VPYENLTLAHDGRVSTLTVNRPQVRNALDTATVGEFHRALDEVREARATVLVITGAGDKAFVSGADVSAIRARRRDDALAGINSRLMSAVESHEAVTIAAVNGYALGGGCELAIACDLRIASESARFGQPEVGLGIIPAAGATYRLPRLIGSGRALEMILTGRTIDAAEALRIGLVNRVVPGDRLLEEARATAALIARKGPLAVRAAKLALQAALHGPDAGHAAERLAQAILFESADKREGMTAFLEGLRPRFKGR
jgi:enoyl-CoA hydratase/carnithine racemase